MKSSFSKDWLTDFERSDFQDSPSYVETLKFFRQFVTKTSYAKMFSIGISPQGRSIECLVVSKDKEFTSKKARNSNKAIVLIQNGIHAGEIDGKDACMLLLRDILVTKEKFYLLDHLILLVIPILNVDGHERVSEFNRPNQNGPKKMGWRTNSWNLNLNRDYLKADTPEIRSYLNLFNEWLPDFFIDNHTTDGADYQYHITYSLEKCSHLNEELSKWGNDCFLPVVTQSVENAGFLVAPYIQLMGKNITDGLLETPALPRLSTGYAAIQNRLGLLVETHSLKPFKNRVQSTFAMNLASLEFIDKKFSELKKINKNADKHTSKINSIDISFELSKSPKAYKFKGFKSIKKESLITGDSVVQYSTVPHEFEVPFYDQTTVAKSIKVPTSYLIPKQFFFVTHLLKYHGIRFSVLKSEKVFFIEEYKFDQYNFSQKPYEGRQCVQVNCSILRKAMSFPRGTIVVKTDQRTNRVIVNLLEPESPDSLVSWGFFNAFFERKEYAESYIMEPIAQIMIKKDRTLNNDFMKKLEEEPNFRNDSEARLDYFYQRSPYFDSQEKIYPIVRVIEKK